MVKIKTCVVACIRCGCVRVGVCVCERIYAVKFRDYNSWEQNMKATFERVSWIGGRDAKGTDKHRTMRNCSESKKSSMLQQNATATSPTQIPGQMNDADEDNIADLPFMTPSYCQYHGHCHCYSTYTQYAVLSIFCLCTRARECVCVCTEGKMGRTINDALNTMANTISSRIQHDLWFTTHHLIVYLHSYHLKW